MPSGKKPSAKSVAIENIITDHCTDKNIKLEVFLQPGNGGDFVQAAISDLQGYNRKDVDNCLSRIRKAFAPTTPKKSTPYKMQGYTNNKRSTADMMDESVAKPPSPMKSVDEGYTPSKKRAKTPVKSYGSSVENDNRNGGFKFNPPPQFNPPQDWRPPTSPFVFGSHAHSQDRGDDVSPLTNMLEAQASIVEGRIGENIIKASNVPKEIVSLVTNDIDFTARATVTGELSTQQFKDGVVRIENEKKHLDRLEEEITKEKNIRKYINKAKDRAIVAKCAEISATESRLVVLKKERDTLEEEKAKDLLDEKKELGKAKAFYNLAIHCFGTLGTCADFALQSGDAVMQAANDLVNKHLDLQDDYKNGEYDKLLESKGGEVKKQLFQRK